MIREIKGHREDDGDEKLGRILSEGVVGCYTLVLLVACAALINDVRHRPKWTVCTGSHQGPLHAPVSNQTASKDVHVPTPHPLENAKLDRTSSGRAADAPDSQPGLEDARTSTGGLPNRTLFCQSSQNLLPRQQIPTSSAERFHHTALEDGKRGIPSLDDDAGRGGVGRPTGGLRGYGLLEMKEMESEGMRHDVRGLEEKRSPFGRSSGDGARIIPFDHSNPAAPCPIMRQTEPICCVPKEWPKTSPSKLPLW